MSILAECDGGWIISHPRFFSDIRFDPNYENSSPVGLKLNPNLFDIKSPFVRTRKGQVPVNPIDQAEVVSRYTTELLTVGSSPKSKIFEELTNGAEGIEDDNNVSARGTATKFFEDVTLDFVRDEVKFNGANTTDFAVMSEVSGQPFLFPRRTAFYSGNIHDVILKEFLTKTPILFDFILMDPPWKNKYIWRNNKRRRALGGGYQLAENMDIGSIPIDKISADGGLIVVWCTNAVAHQNDLVKNMFPRWGLTYLTTWYWVKVTTYGEPICPFNAPDKKQPYETVIIGRYQSPDPTSKPTASKAADGHTSKCSSDVHPDLLRTKVIASIPSSIHSHKPPLIEIFSKYLKPEPKCCELFARYLVPGFTSVGNEVVKLQHSSLYVDAAGTTRETS